MTKELKETFDNVIIEAGKDNRPGFRKLLTKFKKAIDEGNVKRAHQIYYVMERVFFHKKPNDPMERLYSLLLDYRIKNNLGDMRYLKNYPWIAD